MVSDFGVLALLLPSNPIQDHQSSTLLVAEEPSASGWLHGRHPLALGLKPVATEVPEAREKSCVARRDRDGLCPSFLQLVTNHCVHDLQILNCPSPWSGPPLGCCGASASACADILCASRSSAPAHQQEGKAGVAMPALPFYAQVARLARQV